MKRLLAFALCLCLCLGSWVVPMPVKAVGGYSELFPISARFENLERRDKRALPYQDSASRGKVRAGAIVQVVQFVKNDYGNIWAKLTDGSYLCFYSKTTDTRYMKFKSPVVSVEKKLTAPPTGDIKTTSNYGYKLDGTIEVCVPILQLQVEIIDRTTQQQMTVAGSPFIVKPGSGMRKIDLYDTKFDGKSIDSCVLFRKLPAGWYSYQLSLQYGFTYEGKQFKFGSEEVLAQSNFSIGKAGQDVPKYTAKGKRGDANEDGKVTMKDALLVLKYLNDKRVKINFFNADATNDGEVDMTDAIRILRLLD